MSVISSYDAAVVGSGLVAMTAAHALSLSGCRVAWVSPNQINHSTQDDRAIALSAASLDAFKAWQLGAVLDHAADIMQVHVSVKNRFGTLRMDADELAVPCLGKVIAAKHLHAALWQAVQSDGMQRYEGEVNALRFNAQGAQFSCGRNGIIQTLSAKLLLVADGCGAFIKQSLGLHTMIDDYRQHALAAQVHCTAPHQQVAYERFLATGPVAMLPSMDQQRVGMVWALPVALAKAYAALPQAVFNEHLQRAFGYRLGRLSLATPLASFPLQRKRTRPLSHPGMVLLGNAASTCHPVAGQGFNLAVRDVLRLLAIVADLGSKPGLQTMSQLPPLFEQQSILDHQRTTQSTHWLAKCFALDSQLVPMLGGQGLCWLDALPGAKAYLSRRAMGYGVPDAVGV